MIYKATKLLILQLCVCSIHNINIFWKQFFEISRYTNGILFGILKRSLVNFPSSFINRNSKLEIITKYDKKKLEYNCF